MNRFSSDLFFCFLGQQAASFAARCDGMLNFFTFWAFLVFWHFGPCLDAFICVGRFTTNNTTKNTIEIPVITYPFLFKRKHLYFFYLKKWRTTPHSTFTSIEP
ncbi:hypothetical protein QL285_004390 [Trifolium repens]|nr:hypothetical protein QL285_004390 [Trifolium repens]